MPKDDETLETVLKRLASSSAASSPFTGNDGVSKSAMFAEMAKKFSDPARMEAERQKEIDAMRATLARGDDPVVISIIGGKSIRLSEIVAGIDAMERKIKEEKLTLKTMAEWEAEKKPPRL